MAIRIRSPTGTGERNVNRKSCLEREEILFMKAKKRIKRALSLVLAVAILCGILPMNVSVASAATTAAVRVNSMGRKGTVSIGSKKKTGTWWQMNLNGKKAFCMNLGNTCHSGN